MFVWRGLFDGEVEGIGENIDSNATEGIRGKVRAQFQKELYPFKDGSLEKLKKTIGDLRGDLALAMDTLQLDISAAAAQTLDGINDPLKAVSEGIENVGTNVDALTKTFAHFEQDQKHKEMLQWVCSIDPWVNHAAARKKPEATEDWFMVVFFDYREYQELLWTKGWLCGSILLLQIYRHAQQYHSHFLRSIVAQLCQYRPIPKSLEAVYDNDKQTKPSDANLISALSPVIKESGDIFILIDALDESPLGKERYDLLELIEEMHQWSIDSLHILATSREESDIEDIMLSSLNASAVCIEESQNSADINLYVKNQLNGHRRLKKLNEPLKKEIEDTLVSKSNGM
ncbi:hypothetical protein BDD12DRAFT_889482 [Trichophaea hybrida]|nr:hypothetical protein BDD12DRAFT_889482 [Trichophaea hybrida]